jgi:hypothetical protein
MIQGLLSLQDVYDMNIVIPGSEILEGCSHQSMGGEVYIKEPSHLCNYWIGIVVCVVFCSKTPGGLSCSLIVNGNQKYLEGCTIQIFKSLSNHLWLIYVSPKIFNNEWIKSMRECDMNGFCQIGIRINPSCSSSSNLKVKKCGIRMVYKKDIEDHNRITAQCNNNITPYEGMDVPHHNFDNSTVVVETNKAKRSRDEAGPSGQGSSNDVPHPKRIERLTEFMAQGNSDGEESSEFKECREELSDWQESSESDLEG